MKKIAFIGRSLEDLKRFPLAVKREAGYQLDKVQRGGDPVDWKPMPGVGSGVREFRIKDEHGIYRVVYVAKFSDAIYVLHAFTKKTQKTAAKDLAIARKRFKELEVMI